jgi:hypothetical protein
MQVYVQLGQKMEDVWICLNSWTNIVKSLAMDVQAAMDGLGMDIVMTKTIMMDAILMVVTVVGIMSTQHIAVNVHAIDIAIAIANFFRFHSQVLAQLEQLAGMTCIVKEIMKFVTT